MDIDTQTKWWLDESYEDTLQIPVSFIFYMHGVPGGWFLAQLFKWSFESGDSNEWFSKSLADWKSKAAMGKRRVARYTKELTDKGVLETKTEKHGRARETFYKLDTDTLIQKVLEFEAKRKG